MFRELRRKKSALSESECLDILMRQKRGILSLIGDEGYPYGIPMNHYYSVSEGCIYFHCGRAGHKIDAINSCDKASFCVHDEGYAEAGDWALNVKSVIAFGKIKFVEDHDYALDICRKLTLKFTDDEEYIQRELRASGPYVLCLKFEIEHISGKLVHEG